jgi:hypothetical protein
MTYEQIASVLGISRMAVYDAERRAFYKIFLCLLDEFDCEFEDLAKALNLPFNTVKKAFLNLHNYYNRVR